MKQYFEAAHDHQEDRAGICAMYLAGNAKLWWRIRVANTTRTKVRVIDAGYMDHDREESIVKFSVWVAGLSPGRVEEARRQGMHDLATATAAVDDLADLDLRAVESNHEGRPSRASGEKVVCGNGTRPEKGAAKKEAPQKAFLGCFHIGGGPSSKGMLIKADPQCS
ncbi:hypothetical protein AMTR_s00036p00216090 [Amborella trichopoda]|uniref:Retrotransposon gag domain-containing protein n=1 Tax=Amborella trichopoda TaxID=13333 RepID=U5D202_AMBTC|nr:hypothetical protein AMTR_s00036p00216090 [Amborella trichopoda]